MNSTTESLKQLDLYLKILWKYGNNTDLFPYDPTYEVKKKIRYLLQDILPIRKCEGCNKWTALVNGPRCHEQHNFYLCEKFSHSDIRCSSCPIPLNECV